MQSGSLRNSKFPSFMTLKVKQNRLLLIHSCLNDRMLCNLTKPLFSRGKLFLARFIRKKNTENNPHLNSHNGAVDKSYWYLNKVGWRFVNKKAWSTLICVLRAHKPWRTAFWMKCAPSQLRMMFPKKDFRVKCATCCTNFIHKQPLLRKIRIRPKQQTNIRW